MARCHDPSQAFANPTPCLPALAPRLDNESAFTREVVDLRLPHLATRKIHPCLTWLNNVTIQAKGNDTRRGNAQNLWRESLHNLFSALRQPLHRPAYFNHTRFPGRQNIIDHKGRAPIAYRITILLRRHNAMPANIDAIMLRI